MKINKTKLFGRIVVSFLSIIVCISLSPFFLRSFFRISYNYNEGWNMYHTSSFLLGKSLYAYGLTPLNYPPLSFYFSALFTRLGADTLLFSRLFSIVCLLIIAFCVFYIIWRVTNRFFEASIGALFLLSLFQAVAPAYIGLFDPQLMGNMLQVIALAVCFGYTSRSRLAFAAFLFVCAIFIKQNLIILPLAFLFYLFFFERKSFYWFLFSFLGILAVFISITEACNSHFLYWVSLGRVYSLLDLLANTLSVFFLFPFLFVLVPCIFFFSLKKKIYSFFLFYIVFSVCIGFYFATGIGVSVNVLFDFLICLSLMLGVSFYYVFNVVKLPVVKDLGKMFLIFTIIVIMGASFLGFLEALRFETYEDKQKSMRIDVKYIKDHKGAALCEDLLVCYLAGKEFVYDPFMVYSMEQSRVIPSGTSSRLVAQKHFSIIQLSVKRNKKNRMEDRFTSGFLRALQNTYVLDRTSPNGFFYVPR